MGDVFRFRDHVPEVAALHRKYVDETAWICGCGAFNWILYANGDCLCVGCNCISTVIKVVKNGD